MKKRKKEKKKVDKNDFECKLCLHFE